VAGADGPPRENVGGPTDDSVRSIPDPTRIVDRSDFAVELSLARERAGKTVRALAKEVDQPPATIGGYLSGQHLPPIRQTDLFRRILVSLAITDDQTIEQWLEALARVRRKPGPRPAAAAMPYRGLESFRPEDAEWFFGRETLIDDLVAKLAERIADANGSPMVTVVGPSGSGKSSLLRAGLIPAVVQGRLDRGLVWRCLLLSPTVAPLRVLAQHLGALTGAEPAEVEAGLRSDRLDGLALGDEGGGLVIVVDQFEELFTLCPDEAERQAFIAALRRVSRSSPSGLVAVVLGLRADFYGRAAREPALVPALQDHQVLVGPMNAEQLRRAISEPARRAGYEVDADLLDLLIGEFVPRGSASGLHDPGALPLLAHALLETFQRAHRRRLTISDYVETGGINGAVRQTAERVYSELTPDEQALARRIFLRLVNIDEDAVVTRRRVRRAELPRSDPDGANEPGGRGGPGGRGDPGGSSEGLGDGPATPAWEGVVDRFVAHRLLTVHADTVEVSHEALLTAWPRLGDWIDADRDGLRVRRQVSDAARTWAEGQQDSSGLLRGGRLETALTWAGSADHGADLNELERSFLEASADDDRRQRSAARYRTRRLQVLLAVVAALALAGATLAAVAVKARNTAVQARDQALSRQVAIEATRLRTSDPALAAQLALAGFRIAQTPDARSALVDSSGVVTPTRLLGQPGATAVAITSDGRTMAVSRSVDGTVQLFSVPVHGTPAKQGIVPAAKVGAQPFAVAFSPNGMTLAVGGTDNAVRLWDVNDPARPRPLAHPLIGFDGPVQSLAFAPDGQTLAAGGTAAGVLRWDVSVPGLPVVLPPLTGMKGTTQTVTFSPDGATLAAGGTDGTIRLWSMAAGPVAPAGPGAPPALVTQPGSITPPVLVAQLSDGSATTVNSIAFSPNGRILVAGSKDNTVQRWDVANMAAPTTLGPALTGFGSWVNSVAFSADGKTLAAGSSDNNIRLWNVDHWQPRTTTLAHPAPVTALRFLPGSDSLVSVAEDGAARIWPLPGPIIDGPTDTVWTVAYSADGRRLLVSPGRSDPGGTELWDASNSQHPTLLGRAILPPGIGTSTGSGSISPNGRLLAMGTAAGNVQLFDIADPSAPMPLGSALKQATMLIEQTAFSADGHLLAAASDDSTVGIWDLTDPSRPVAMTRLTEPTNEVLAIAFSPTGRLLSAASADKAVYLWQIDAAHHVTPAATLHGFDNYAYAVVFTPDGRVLAAGSADKTLRLWDVSDPRRPRPLGGPIDGPGNYVYYLAIDPKGRTLAAAVTDGTVWQWDISNPAGPRALTTLTAMTGSTFVVAYSPDGRTLAAAGNNHTVHFWSTDPQQIATDICSSTGDAITLAEWEDYLPDRPYRRPCP
jgi:WD40 repeat protein